MNFNSEHTLQFMKLNLLAEILHLKFRRWTFIWQRPPLEFSKSSSISSAPL